MALEPFFSGSLTASGKLTTCVSAFPATVVSFSGTGAAVLVSVLMASGNRTLPTVALVTVESALTFSTVPLPQEESMADNSINEMAVSGFIIL